MRIAVCVDVPNSRGLVIPLRALLAFLLSGAVLLFANNSVGSEKAGNGTATPVTDVSSPDSDEIARVLALSNDMEWGEYLAGECATCHGASPGAGSVPGLYGIDSAYIVRALLEYRSGIRSNSTMGSVAEALGDEEVAVLAHYLATVEP